MGINRVCTLCLYKYIMPTVFRALIWMIKYVGKYNIIEYLFYIIYVYIL